MIVLAGASPSCHAKLSHRSAIGLSSQLRVFVVHRTGTCFDTAVVPACSGPARNVRIDWIILQGRAYLRCGAGRTIAAFGPGSVLTMAESDFEGTRGTRTHEFHFHGEPFCAMELRYRVNVLPTEPRVAQLAEEALALVAALVEPTLKGDAVTLRSGLPDVVTALNAVGVGPEVTSIRDLELDARLAQTMVATYNAFDLTSSLKTMAAAAELSLRQYARLAKGAFHSLLLLPHDGFRATMSNLRIRVATCLLSHPEVSVADVARAVGYSRPEAMDGSFRAAGLPSPSEVRQILRALHVECEEHDRVPPDRLAGLRSEGGDWRSPDAEEADERTEDRRAGDARE